MNDSRTMHIDRLRAELAATRSRMKKLAKGRLEAAADTAARHMAELAAKDARIAELETKLTATENTRKLNGALCDLSLANYEALRKELAETKERIACYWNPTAVAWQLEAEKLRKELAEAQATSLADRKRSVDVGNALQTSLGLANKELAEAKRCRDNAEAALEVYDRTFPKKSELELHAALEAANAERDKWMEYATGDRAELALKMEAANADISDLRRKVSDHEKYTSDIEEACNNLRKEADQEAGDAVDAETALEAANATIEHEKAQTKIVLDSYATENQQLHDRVEAANARIAELETHMFNTNCVAANDLLAERARAERAEADCKALREALEQIESILVRGDKSVSYMLMKARAALNPSLIET